MDRTRPDISWAKEQLATAIENTTILHCSSLNSFILCLRHTPYIGIIFHLGQKRLSKYHASARIVRFLLFSGCTGHKIQKQFYTHVQYNSSVMVTKETIHRRQVQHRSGICRASPNGTYSRFYASYPLTYYFHRSGSIFVDTDIQSATDTVTKPFGTKRRTFID